MSLRSRLRDLLHPGGHVRPAEEPWWDHDYPAPKWPRGMPSLPMIQHVVDNRVFLLGLDQLYREAMKGHERGELLACARRTAQALDVGPADVPVEGYYADEPALTEYFRLVRSLQLVPLSRSAEVDSFAEFRRLLDVTSSPLFGIPQRRHLLPVGRDPLSAALRELTQWTVPALAACAARIACEQDDFSLVGLGARAKDPVVLAALRESVVLYAEEMTLGTPPAPEYVWAVEPELAAAAKRFVDEFNRVMGYGLPQPVPQRAWVFWTAYEKTDVVGRCVHLGHTDEPSPRHYHWAIVRDAQGRLGVREFWSNRVHTTEEYRRTGVEGEKPDARAASDAWLDRVRGTPGLRGGDFR